MRAVACTTDRLHVDAAHSARHSAPVWCVCVQVEELQQLVLKVQPLAYKSESSPGFV